MLGKRSEISTEDKKSAKKRGKRGHQAMAGQRGFLESKREVGGAKLRGDRKD